MKVSNFNNLTKGHCITLLDVHVNKGEEWTRSEDCNYFTITLSY